MHLFFYVRLLAFFNIKRGKQNTDGNLSKAKLGIFIEEQGATNHESLRTTGLNHQHVS